VKKKILVDYTSREFNSIKNDLENHARLYYPDSYKDFSENSFGSFVLDSVAYVGDMLSFYLDYQVNESFMDTSVEYENIRRHAKNKGFKLSGPPAAFGMATFYVSVPANSVGQGPNRQLIPILKSGTEVATDSGVSFVLLEDVDFSNPKNEAVASKFSSTTGDATHYAIRAFGQVKSVSLYRIELEIGDFERFRQTRVGSSAIQEIHSVFDSNGHQYYEVDHLSQDLIYVNTTNPNALSDGVPQIIKPKKVVRRFVVERDINGTYLRFGYSNETDDTSNDIIDPSTISLKMSGKKYITDTAFDPTTLLKNNNLGISPQNTTLTVLFYKNSSDSINVASGQITNFVTKPLEFPGDISSSRASEIRSSLEVSNEEPIVGNTETPTSEEIKMKTMSEMFSQNRAVTRNDYEAMAYSMPASFGSVKRASIVNDPSSTNRRLSMYVISVDNDNNLITTNQTIKENLKVWLGKVKMLNDNIDIMNAKIVNIGFDYKIIVQPAYDKITALNSVNNALNDYFNNKMYIGEPLYLTEIFSLINRVEGVVDTTQVTPVIKDGSIYSGAPLSLSDIKSKDGTYLKAPKNVIFEIKYPKSDIRGTAV
tara:strand:+ start:23835 stop:25619 length:1785 start_codon:yes stop_codon:yes gene_type:complete